MIEEVAKIDLDEIDRRILEILQINGRDSASSIAEAVNLSVPAASDRIKKLQDLDIIRGFEAIINVKKIGLDVAALVTVISESSSNFEKVIDCVNGTPEIVECYATTGGQPVPNSEEIDYAVIAEGSGYAATYSFDDLEELSTSLDEIMNEKGPVFVAIKVEAEVENLPIGLRERRETRNRAQTITDLRQELGIS